MNKIILASSSPRRKELLNQIGIPFEIMVSNYDEKSCIKQLPAQEFVKYISMQKAKEVSSRAGKSTIILAGDTVVTFNNEILGKPKDEKDAFRMLKILSGNMHVVYTGVAIITNIEQGMKEISFYEKTKVNMRPFSDEEILFYIKTGEPMDKAGAYGIQGFGAVFIESIEGDFNNVVGLPLTRVYMELKNIIKSSCQILEIVV